MDAFLLQTPAGSRRLVLRRYRPSSSQDPRVQAERCWRTLKVLEQLRLPAPRPIWLDPAGELFSAPGLVMTRIAGRPDLLGSDIAGWTDQLAAALLRIHRAPIDTVDLPFLPAPGQLAAGRLNPASEHRGAVRMHGLGEAVLDALHAGLPALEPVPAVLVHGDYWAGNTLSRAGRVVAVVDWDDAALDEPGLDVGYCRMDLAMLGQPGAPDLFLRAYERHAGAPVANLAFWDLFAALAALPNPERWLPGYHGLGRADITPDEMRRGLDAFIRDALRHAAQSLRRQFRN